MCLCNMLLVCYGVTVEYVVLSTGFLADSLTYPIVSYQFSRTPFSRHTNPSASPPLPSCSQSANKETLCVTDILSVSKQKIS